MKGSLKDIENQIKEEAHRRGLTRLEFLRLLLEVYSVERVDILISQIRSKHLQAMISPAERASLGILKEYLELILCD